MDGGDVLVETRERICIITINRPHVRNALDASVARGVARAVDELDADPRLRAGILTGAGGTFSSGMDLKAKLRGETPAIEGRGLCGITRTPPRKPLIAAVEGWALAGGFELLLACDMVVASESATFGVPEVRRSMVAGGGAALFLPQRIPHVVAMELLLTGGPVGSDRAVELGIVNRVVAAGMALPAAVELAQAVARNGPLAVEATKAIARANWSPEVGWERQDEIVRQVSGSDDAREGALAFAEKREPHWRGR